MRSRRRFHVAPLVLFAAGVACGARERVLPPPGEVLIVIDTDMPVPRMVNRLRIDLYTPNHEWYASRDTARAKPSDFPTSFGVYVPANDERQVLVRLRAYPEGEVRDYRGERFAPRPTQTTSLDPAPVPPPSDSPRLKRDDGSDATPKTEPSPVVTIDRLLRVRVRPDDHAAVRIVLRGACVGTMADLSGEQTCIDTENVRVPVAEEATIADTSLPSSSLAGTFDFAQKCTQSPRAAGQAADGTPLYDEEVCVDGAMFLFGSSTGFGFAAADDWPKRVAVLPPFRIDRYEVTVARWRDAVAHGFIPEVPPTSNDGPLPREGADIRDTRGCTWSTKPMGREDYPITCMRWFDARTFCRWSGGDLPTEAQWEYVATDAGRPFHTAYPWGGDAFETATCDQVVAGRGALPYDDDCNKDLTRFGPQPVHTSARPGQDSSLGLGVVGLAGGVTEFMLDVFASFSSSCWASQGLHDPRCAFDSTSLRTVRGGNWGDPLTNVLPSRRVPVPLDQFSTQAGFRCVRAGS